MRGIHSTTMAIGLAALVLPLTATVAVAQPSAKHQRVIDHWTPERMRQAIPRQLVIAPNGLGYLKMPDGSLRPHGHDRLVAMSQPTPQPQAKPGSDGGDVDGPDITRIEPTNGATIGASHRFAATITDTSGVRSASLVITYPDGRTQSFGMNNSGDVWENSLSGFSNGDWSWRVEATDNTRGKGNTTVTDEWVFTVDTNGEPPPPPPDGDVVTNARWGEGDPVLSTVGRIYFEMPSNARLKRWAGYVCSGTVVTDADSPDRSVIITAAHCAYDDANKAFARNVLFIPNQDGTTGSGTDTNCSNDPIGCWSPSFAVVDTNWTTSIFPDNIPWDYAYYVVDNVGAHSGSAAVDSLEAEVGGLDISFADPVEIGDSGGLDPYTHAIGYSYADDPNLMYCAEDMTTEGAYNWWLPNCGLSGGSSGGPWIQPMTSGGGPIISVNSWGYSSSPGMAGPFLHVTSASCLIVDAETAAFSGISPVDGSEGVVVDCP